MTKKSWMLIGFALALAVAYAVFFTNRFKPGTIKIYHLTRPTGYAMQTRRNGPPPPITFGLEGPHLLTEIKVVPLAGYLTNKNILPLWHLVSGSNSEPVKTFSYGDYSHAIKGMSPALEGIAPEPLATNVIYHLLVNAGKIKGEHDFELR